MNVLDFLKQNILILDGGMGTLLQSAGLPAGEHPERWNITHPEVIRGVHKAYFDAGSNVVNTNTFGANPLKFSSEELEEIVAAAVKNARDAANESKTPHEKFVALDIGPTGRLLRPYGDFDFEDAVSAFAEIVRLGAKYGADLVFIETMNDSYETKAALLAAKENCSLPVFVSNAYGEDGKLMTGASPAAMVAMLEGMGADAVGVNCSFGPKALMPVVREYLSRASVPVFFKPNAGMPRVVDGKTKFDVLPEEFSADVAVLVREGVSCAGGCCGTTPEYIAALKKACEGISQTPVTDKNITCASSYTHTVDFGGRPVLIGERINPTGKKRFKEALREHDIDYILNEGIGQQEKGAHILDVNVGLPEIDEPAMLKESVCELQAILDLPLQIDTSNIKAMEGALRRVNGKAMINSVNGKKESMEAIFPLVRKYGGLVVALTLDESGIPDTAEGRVEIARNILKTAESYGVAKKDIVFDPLCLTISAQKDAALETLKAVRIIREELGCHTSLGVSNVSFGLPQRENINSTFFALALENGLSAAIMNPYSAEMLKVYYSFCALHGFDDNCGDYIAFCDTVAPTASLSAPSVKADSSALQHAIIKGLKDQAGELTAALLGETAPLDIVQNEIIPALDEVGRGFEAKTVYLPQLLMSAEAAKSAFAVIKDKMSGEKVSADRCRFVIATVKGDIHDIGKNIVKLLLENYGFAVTDLGRDVSPEDIVDAVRRLNAPVVGLSALMTTTVVSMEETIKQLREAAPECRIIVGGAVLNREYAQSIGADYYAKDAMETVRFAEEINKVIPS